MTRTVPASSRFSLAATALFGTVIVFEQNRGRWAEPERLIQGEFALGSEINE